MADEESEDHPSIYRSVRRAVSEIDILLGGVKNTEVVNNLRTDGRTDEMDPQGDADEGRRGEAKLRSPYRAVTSPQR